MQIFAQFSIHLFAYFRNFSYLCTRKGLNEQMIEKNPHIKTIRKHINNALREELAGEVVGAKFASTTPHGAMEDKTQTNEVMFYNLEMVTSVGFRVKSQRGVQFRKWNELNIGAKKTQVIKTCAY